MRDKYPSELYGHNIIRCKCSFCQIERQANRAFTSTVQIAGEYRSGRYG